MIATDDPNLVFLRGSDLIIRECAQMPPDKLSRDQLSRAALLALTGRGPEHLAEIEEVVRDNPPLHKQFSRYIGGTAKGAARDKKMAAAEDDTRSDRRRVSWEA